MPGGNGKDTSYVRDIKEIRESAGYTVVRHKDG